jgi:hypothetical protein
VTSSVSRPEMTGSASSDPLRNSIAGANRKSCFTAYSPVRSSGARPGARGRR